MLKQPNSLKPGDLIEIISTARKIDISQMDGVQKLLEGWGFRVKWGAAIRKEFHQFCGTDEERAKDLQDAIDNPEVKAILCFRGGYGTIRILDKVDFSGLVQNPKWIVGYSDVTALHGQLNKLGLMSIHGSMPVNFMGNTPEALNSLRNALEGSSNTYRFDARELNRLGSATGELIGGNLSMIYSIAGTPYDFDFEDKILFIEDLDEYLYHIDRMMQNLKHSGKLAELKGLIVGGMTDMNDNTIPFGSSAVETISKAVSEYDYPVCFDFPVGHIDDNRALVIGKECAISVSNQEVIFKQ
ncbi:S66 peptidase family protein [Parvicella tangerina]|uniref:Murein peptide carboxypeptidase n=1 Tax=Parvicella tangerina TaxID=2829795 RepID=A0A916N998_9FLAO|nr:LD-carboxypeptidase [Parvicella tangerina]CAG5076737.1 putative murein peptide carboxypeptidase [Parvicella tangerina]